MRRKQGTLIVATTAASLLLLVVFFGGLRTAAANGPGWSQAQVEAEEQVESVQAAADWLLLTHQNEDGGFASFSAGAGMGPSDPGGTADAILALAAAGYNPAARHPAQEVSAVEYLQANADFAADYAAQGGGQAGKLILALAAAGQDPRTFAGYDLVISLTQQLSPTGQYNVMTPFDQGLAILAQETVSGSVPAEATDWLRGQQATEGELAGSWGDGFGTAGNIDATAMAMMALLATGATPDDALVAARDYLAQKQLPSGGWPYAPDLAESANSTALALQALSALGEDFYSAEGQWAANGVSPLGALLAWQGESGAFQADFGQGPADDFFATVQALPAAAGRAYPLTARLEAAQRGLSCLVTLRDPATGGWPAFAGGEPDAGGTARAMQALSALGADLTAEQWAVEGTTPLQALEALTPVYLEGGRGGRAGIVTQGVIAAAGNPNDFAGVDLPLLIGDYLSPTGAYADTGFGIFSHAEAILGLLLAGAEPEPAAVELLLQAQGEDGGWASPDDTGIALQVLGRMATRGVESPATDADIERALAALQASQLADGGWSGFEETASVNSTSEVGQGLLVLGLNPFTPDWSVVTSGTLRNAADAVAALQGENGCWPNLFGPGDDPFSTTDALLLLAAGPPYGTGDGVMAAAEAEAAAETPTEEATAEATATAEPTATFEATATPAPTETAPPPTDEPEVVVQAATPTPTPTPSLQTADVEEAAEALEEVEGTDPIIAWVILILALVLTAVVGFWATLSRGR